jgi:hypothetical protein
MNRKQNVTKQMATNAARNGMHETGRQAVIWYDNPRDGWRWDYQLAPQRLASAYNADSYATNRV